MYDEISTLHCALTDLHLENTAGVSSKIRFKMDTGASGNLLSVSVYHELFPNCTMKDLCMTIDPNVELLTATKSSIKQLGTWYDKKGGILHCVLIRIPSLIQTTDQWVMLPIAIYCIVVYSLCYILLVSLSLSHACAPYTNAIPIGSCPLIPHCWGGMTSTEIQIFISSLPSLGKGPQGKILQLRVWKNWFLFIRLLRKIPKMTASVWLQLCNLTVW